LIVHECQLIYDVRSESVPLWTLALGLSLIIVGAALARFMPRARFMARWSVLIFALVWTFMMCLAVRPYYSLRKALPSGAYITIEGPITEYHALEERQHGLEYFVVDGSRFAFSSGDIGPGFKWTRVRGSRLDVGSYVRLAVVDDIIVRLEICKTAGL